MSEKFVKFLLSHSILHKKCYNTKEVFFVTDIICSAAAGAEWRKNGKIYITERFISRKGSFRSIKDL